MGFDWKAFLKQLEDSNFIHRGEAEFLIEKEIFTTPVLTSALVKMFELINESKEIKKVAELNKTITELEIKNMQLEYKLHAKQL